jgi:hypothetical protein
MLKNLIMAALAAAFALAFAGVPVEAITVDPQVAAGTKIIPARQCSNTQNMCYLRVTLNWNDADFSVGGGATEWVATLPKNAYILAIDADVTTAFTSGQGSTLVIGATKTSGNEIVASGITMTTGGLYHLTSAAGLGVTVTGSSTYQTQLNGAVPVYFKYGYSGTVLAGSVTVLITYAQDNDQ